MATLIELIKILRDRTGAGMMDCKKALVENDQDVEKAIDWLREKGIAKAAKKSTRIAAEGSTYVTYCEGCKKALIFEINCETDFVAKSESFKKLITDSASAIMHADKICCIECCKKAIEPLFNDAVIKLGEKLDFRRYQLVNIEEGKGVGTYIHMGGKISVLLTLNKENKELAKGIAMTIAANNPQYVSADDIPAEALQKETEIQEELSKNDPKLASKPANVLKGIIQGKVNKIFAESVLLKQEYVLDPTKTVEQVLKENDNSVESFIRYQVGEGLEKRVDNFAEEVLNQTK